LEVENSKVCEFRGRSHKTGEEKAEEKAGEKILD
jgi:hypothetical protein